MMKVEKNKTTGENRSQQSWFENFSSKATKTSGSSSAFILAILMILIWAVTGPVFGYSEGWQLVINTGTTIVTFLMVFLIQKTQNKDALAIQVKLNELLAASKFTNNRIVSIEDLSEEELERLHEYYTNLAQLIKKDKNPLTSYPFNDKLIDGSAKSSEMGSQT
jgi:low affinity Fe/Cu permease